MNASVIVADDQAVVREGIVMLLGLLPGIEVVGAARDGEEAVALVARLAPDVVLAGIPVVGMCMATSSPRASSLPVSQS